MTVITVEKQRLKFIILVKTQQKRKNMWIYTLCSTLDTDTWTNTSFMKYILAMVIWYYFLLCCFPCLFSCYSSASKLPWAQHMLYFPFQFSACWAHNNRQIKHIYPNHIIALFFSSTNICTHTSFSVLVLFFGKQQKIHFCPVYMYSQSTLQPFATYTLNL